MGDLVLDLLLPPTDRAVAIQWMVMVPLWLFAVVATWRWARDPRHLVWGLITMNLAWFALRAAH